MLNFHADHYFHIGSSHYSSGKPCQDYALSEANNFLACAIVSDGCSTGRHTDIGSRVLTLSTIQAVRDHFRATERYIGNAVIGITSRQQQIISTSRMLLGLNHEDMLATCGYVYITHLGGFVHIQGDGVVALKYRDGQIKMHRFEWANNTPFYPSYGDGGVETFVRAHGGDLEVVRMTQSTVVYQSKTGTYVGGDPKGLTLRQGLEGIVINIREEDLNLIEFVAVFSDGVNQIESVDWISAVVDFLSFKSTTGEFAKRRMIRGVQNYQKTGKGPIDDISYAVVRIEKTEDRSD